MFNHCFPLQRTFLLLLCWVTAFYLYAPLREHSCHYEYNVHCPKVFIDWFMIMVSLVLKLFVSSRPLKLEGVLCIYVLLSLKDKLKTICMFFLTSKSARATHVSYRIYIIKWWNVFNQMKNNNIAKSSCLYNNLLIIGLGTHAQNN
jgi:hypothetical protein